MPHKGSSLEVIILASQTDVVLTQIANAAKMVPKRTAPGRFAFGAPAQKEWETKLVKGPVDFVGTVRQTGESIFLDAKMDQTVSRFRCDDQHVKESQVVELVRHGRVGAHAGLLIYATSRGAFFWLNWHHLPGRGPSIPWSDPRMIFLGNDSRVIQWQQVLTARRAVPSRLFESAFSH